MQPLSYVGEKREAPCGVKSLLVYTAVCIDCDCWSGLQKCSMIAAAAAAAAAVAAAAAAGSGALG
jgi:hypothetical protein